MLALNLEAKGFRKVKRAFRREIQPQLKALKMARSVSLNGKLFVLTDCGLVLPYEQVQVHHDPPLAFLIAQFLASKGLTLAQVRRAGTRLADRALAREWREWHARQARLFVVSEWVHKALEGRANGDVHGLGA